MILRKICLVLFATLVFATPAIAQQDRDTTEVVLVAGDTLELRRVDIQNRVLYWIITVAGQDTLPAYQDTLPVYQDTLPVYQDTLPVYQDTLPPIQDTIPCICDTIPVPLDTIPEIPPTVSSYLLSISTNRYEMTGMSDVVEGDYYIHVDRPDGAWLGLGDISMTGVDSVIFVFDGRRNRERLYPYEVGGGLVTAIPVGQHTVTWEVYGDEPDSDQAMFNVTSLDPEPDPPPVDPVGLTLPDTDGAVLYWDYENYASTDEFRNEPWRDGGWAEGHHASEKMFIDFNDPFPGLTRSIRYDWVYANATAGTFSHTIGVEKHFDGWEPSRQGQEIWGEFSFRVNDLFTSCNMLKNPCDYKTVFFTVWPDQNGRFGIHMFGGNGASAVEGRTYQIVWKTPTGLVAGDPTATGIGSSTSGMGQNFWYVRGRETTWNKIQIYMRFSSRSGGTVETNSMDAKVVMWMNGEKFADSEESGIVFGTFNKFNPDQPIWIRGCSLGRNKDKGGGFTDPSDYPITESIWFAYCAMWDEPTEYTNSWN